MKYKIGMIIIIGLFIFVGNCWLESLDKDKERGGRMTVKEVIDQIDCRRMNG